MLYLLCSIISDFLRYDAIVVLKTTKRLVKFLLYASHAPDFASVVLLATIFYFHNSPPYNWSTFLFGNKRAISYKVVKSSLKLTTVEVKSPVILYFENKITRYFAAWLVKFLIDWEGLKALYIYIYIYITRI